MTTVSRRLAFPLDAPIDRVFPLLSPEGETLWVPGWRYTPLVDAHPLAEDGVFLTEGHDHGAAEAIWLVKRYEPERHHVTYYKIEPEEKVGVVDVRCRALSDARTEVEVGYRYTALAPAGEVFVAEFSAEAYADFMAEWRRLMEAYFESSGDSRQR